MESLFPGKMTSCVLLAILSMLSCTRVTDLVPEGRGEVVVICVLTEEDTQSLTLSLTDIAKLEDQLALSEAEILLYDESSGKEVGVFVKGNGTEWQLDYAAIPEHRYQLIISIPGRKQITATTTMPHESEVIFSFNPFYYGTAYEIASLPEGALWMMAMNHDSGAGHMVAERIATSLTTADPFNVTDEIFHAFEFFDEIIKYAESGRGNDFFYPNVEGQPMFDKMFRIPPIREINRESKEGTGWFSVAGYFRTAYHPYRPGRDPGQMEKKDGYIRVISPSEEYDRYLREVISRKMQQQAVGDYAFLFSRKNVYTNIANGLGVFGAKTEQKLPWNDQRILSY